MNWKANVLKEWKFGLSTGEKMMKSTKLQGHKTARMERMDGNLQATSFGNKSLQGNIRFQDSRLQPIRGWPKKQLVRRLRLRAQEPYSGVLHSRGSIGLYVWRLVYLSYSVLYWCRPEVAYFLGREITQKKVWISTNATCHICSSVLIEPRMTSVCTSRFSSPFKDCELPVQLQQT